MQTIAEVAVMHAPRANHARQELAQELRHHLLLHVHKLCAGLIA